MRLRRLAGRPLVKARASQSRRHVEQPQSGSRIISGDRPHQRHKRRVECARLDHRYLPLHSPVMITLAEPDPYLLAETEERPAQQDDRESKKDTGSVYV